MADTHDLKHNVSHSPMTPSETTALVQRQAFQAGFEAALDGRVVLPEVIRDRIDAAYQQLAAEADALTQLCVRCGHTFTDHDRCEGHSCRLCECRGCVTETKL